MSTTKEEQKKYYKNYYKTHPEYRERQKARARKQRENPTEQYKKWQKDYADRRMAILAHYKNVPCADCGESYPHYVMDFHHRDREEKLFTITMARKYKLERILAEIKKCDVLCSNCHRIRTWKYNHEN